MTTQTTPTTTNQPSEPPILRRARALARAAGSRATTVRGIVRAAVGAYPSRRAYGFRCWRDEAVISAYPEVAVVDVPDGWRLAGWRLAGERRRLVRIRDTLLAVHREAARLAASPRSLGALRGAVTRWQRVDAPTLAEWDDADRSAATRIRAAVLRIRRAEAWASARQDGLLAAMRAVDEVVISDDDLDIRHGRQPVVIPGLTGRLTALRGHTDRERRELSPRAGVSWRVQAGARTEILADDDYEVRFASSGQVCHRPDKEIQRADHTLSVRSVGYVRDDGALDWVVGMRSGTLAAPEGWRWAIDDEGIHLADGRGADYHPDALDLVGGLDVAAMAVAAGEALQDRIRADREAAEAAREVEGVYVHYLDARRSGHCAGGIRTWCSQHGIDIRRHVPAPVLLRRYPDDPRIRRIVGAAARRHAEEVERGHADLRDHRVPVDA